MGRSSIFAITILSCLLAITIVRSADTHLPFARAPFDAKTASDLQKETASSLDLPLIRKIDLGNNTDIEFILIPAGEFDMGSSFLEKARSNDEGPVRRVKISKPFYIGRYEVTQAQWKAVTGHALSSFKGIDRPVDGVSWPKAVNFCQRLSERELETFRLPTEAEWEYTCRAGTKTAYSFGDDSSYLAQCAWFNNNSEHGTHPVGQKEPNAFGLHDMHGNVWEWCIDRYDSYDADSIVDPTGPSNGGARILRGGSWFCTPGPCRSANRGWNIPEARDDDVGFRIVLECSD
ncbi:MAG: formylglycine-generating enzyme family protein [Sedimentisphaerales bacterium]|nr:formylglycine-generating enzyme family protein [Sedimentisphaerales bacterium]